MLADFFKGKRIFLTGHSGFKGSWLTCCLKHFEAEVFGFSRFSPTKNSMYELCGLNAFVKRSYQGNICNLLTLKKAISEAKPDIIIHLAAQPLVQESYKNPMKTYESNVMGTVNLLEAVRTLSHEEGLSVKALLCITTDKVHENREWVLGNSEKESLGGYDPYSSSKACAEIAIASYRHSYFCKSGTVLATARAGNVIGGGDFSPNRLVPNCMSAYAEGKPVVIRSPDSIRPWQHVLEPLRGYLMLCRAIYENDDKELAGSFNFGPNEEGAISSFELATRLNKYIGGYGIEVKQAPNAAHEAGILKLDASKAKNILGWTPILSLDESLKLTVDWFKSYLEGKDMYKVTLEQVAKYFKLFESANV